MIICNVKCYTFLLFKTEIQYFYKSVSVILLFRIVNQFSLFRLGLTNKFKKKFRSISLKYIFELILSNYDSNNSISS